MIQIDSHKFEQDVLKYTYMYNFSSYKYIENYNCVYNVKIINFYSVLNFI